MAEPDDPGSFKRLGRRAGHAVFPPPPLKFRTAGFPQYGFKPEFGGNLRRSTLGLYAASSPASPPALWPFRASWTKPVREPIPRAIRSRGPWLASRLYCPARSSLTMASSEPLGLSCRLMYSRAGLCHCGQGRKVPHFYLRVLHSVPSPLPRRIGRLHLAVASPTVVAFAAF